MNEKLTDIFNKIIEYIEINFTEYLENTKQIRTFIVAYLFALNDNNIISKNEYIELINDFYMLDWNKYESNPNA